MAFLAAFCEQEHSLASDRTLKEDGLFAFAHSYHQTCQAIKQTKMLQRS